MEDNKAVVTELPSATEYPSAAYGGYNAVSTDGSMYSNENIGDQAHSGSGENAAYAADGPNYAGASLYGNVSTAADKGDSADASYPAEPSVPASGNGAGYESNTNGCTNEVVSTAHTATVDNGNFPSETVVTADQQFGDASEMSGEESRLWGLVRANCLDFNAWTSLIQETEKESNILKIRKVYDAFLAEFPLCFGYWKKYADHEGQLDTIEKVVEVYERAVLAVTYSVDIWVHYCQFAISTRGDPENIRSMPATVFPFMYGWEL